MIQLTSEDMNNFKDYLEIGRIATRALLGVYCAGAWSMLGASIIQKLFSPKIRNESELESVLATERTKLRIDDSIKIKAKLSENNMEGSYAVKRAQGEYEINLAPGSQNLATLKHELYHIADGHCIKVVKEGEPDKMGVVELLKYLHWQEPRAVFYGTNELMSRKELAK